MNHTEAAALMKANEATVVNPDATERAPVQPARPPAHWTKAQSPPNAEAWTYGRFYVISRVGLAQRKSGTEMVVLMLAIVKGRYAQRRPTDTECDRVLTAFGMDDVEEIPGREGRYRHFVKPAPMD